MLKISYKKNEKDIKIKLYKSIKYKKNIKILKKYNVI